MPRGFASCSHTSRARASLVTGGLPPMQWAVPIDHKQRFAMLVLRAAQVAATEPVVHAWAFAACFHSGVTARVQGLLVTHFRLLRFQSSSLSTTNNVMSARPSQNAQALTPMPPGSRARQPSLGLQPAEMRPALP